MQHQPNIFIVDMFNMALAYGNKCESGMFYSPNAMLAEPDEANIESAIEGILTVNLNWLTQCQTILKKFMKMDTQ